MGEFGRLLQGVSDAGTLGTSIDRRLGRIHGSQLPGFLQHDSRDTCPALGEDNYGDEVHRGGYLYHASR